MSLANHLHRQRSGRYHVRLRVPKDLVAVIGKTELWKTCSTTDPEKAKDEKAEIVRAWREWFKELRRKHRPTDEEIDSAVYHFYSREVELDVQERQRFPTQEQIDGAAERLRAEIESGRSLWEIFGDGVEVIAMKEAPELAQHRRAEQERELRQHLMRGETALIEWAADEIIAREGF
ncbi:MAG TPA: DUF6538 domain-containing protein, partial [Alphaproteobacteria bacterium]|nr:DUF6538 domain-containing protein [Alphaproteobacteria bacterium]